MTELLTAELPTAVPSETPQTAVWSLQLQLLHRSAVHSPANRATARAASLNWLTSSQALRATMRLHDLPDGAYDGVPFEIIDEGIIVRATRNASGKHWHFLSEHPDHRALRDPALTGRRWRLETIVVDKGDHDLLGTRLSCLAAASFIPLRTPGVHKDFIAGHSLRDGDIPVENAPLIVGGHVSYERLLKHLRSPSRKMPLVVISGTGDHRAGRDYLIDPPGLAQTLQGLAHVAALPADYWHSLRRDIGPKLGVSHGSVRVFQPGVAPGDDWVGHWVYGRNGMGNPPDLEKLHSSLYHRVRKASLRSPEFIASWPDVGATDTALPGARGVFHSLKRMFSRDRRA